jgi:CheY-like chemotaxis protein
MSSPQLLDVPSASKNSLAHVLVVEDDVDSREFLRYFLEKDGLGVSCAANGREALDRLRVEPLPDLILLDLMMPVMNGWEFLAYRQEQPALAGIPVMILSSLGRPAAAVPAGEVVDFVDKPVDLSDLISKVRRQVSPN